MKVTITISTQNKLLIVSQVFLLKNNIQETEEQEIEKK